MKPIAAFLCALTAISLPACEAESVSDGDFAISYRGSAQNRANGNLKIYIGASTADPGDVVWDIVDDDVSTAGAGAAGQSQLLVSVDDNKIFDANGSVRCELFPMGSDGDMLVEELRDGSTGDVLFTVRGKRVYYGSQPVGGSPNASDLAFTFKGAQVFEGKPSDGVVLVTASEKIRKASEMRKLTIAALIDGACGAPGLP
ncbi:MAG: hypothetical protein AB1Z98_36560 [Nannocystaceae bacterium]